MGDPACYMHLLDEDGRMPEPIISLEDEDGTETPEEPILPPAIHLGRDC